MAKSPNAALLKAARHVIRGLDREDLAQRAARVRGCIAVTSDRISVAGLRDLCDAVAAFDKPDGPAA